MTKIYLIRHGESEATVRRVFSNGRVDLHLTQRGRTQARQVAGRLEGRGVAHVYSAPLRRAQDTAAIVATHLGLGEARMTVLRDLDEVRFGEPDGRSDRESWDLYHAVIDRWRAGERNPGFSTGEMSNGPASRTRGTPYLAMWHGTPGEDAARLWQTWQAQAR
jgi:broad specificity phosphatase PhoE